MLYTLKFNASFGALQVSNRNRLMPLSAAASAVSTCKCSGLSTSPPVFCQGRQPSAPAIRKQDFPTFVSATHSALPNVLVWYVSPVISFMLASLVGAALLTPRAAQPAPGRACASTETLRCASHRVPMLTYRRSTAPG